MRNLILIIWKYYFFLMFLLLELIAGYLVIQNNKFQNASFINSSNAVSSSILNLVNDITEYINLKPTNKILAAENARLRSIIYTEYYSKTNPSHQVSDSLKLQKYTYIDAKVVNNSTNKRNNYLTLNRGKLNGIKEEMSVLSSTGIVGIVKDVSNHFCTVISVLHKDFHTSVKLIKNNYTGNLEWPGGDPNKALVVEMPNHVKLNKGDTLVTTSFSAVFPEGIPVATIDSFEIKPGDNFYTIRVNLTTHFQNISYVYIVNNLQKEEQRKLEESHKND
jgi:rod shape-determining protein MreC